jgi:hypothetical protein
VEPEGHYDNKKSIGKMRHKENNEKRYGKLNKMYEDEDYKRTDLTVINNCGED